MNLRLAIALCALLLPVFSATAADSNAAPGNAASKQSVDAKPGKADQAGNLFQAIRKRGVLVAGTSFSIPWAMLDPEEQWQGFEIDVARQLAGDLGVELKIVRVPIARLTDALESGSIDIAIAGYSITPQRALVVEFSNAYAESQMELVVRKDLAAQDIDRSDVKIGVRAGSTSEAAALAKLPNVQVITFPDAPKLYAAVQAGQVDGALAYVPRTSIAIAQSEGKLARATKGPALPHTVEAFAVRRGEQSLLNYLNAWIAFWKADGWIADRHHYWFETLEWTSRFTPPNATPAK